MLARLWWGSNEKCNKIHSMSWSRIKASKIKGGMVFKELESFNLALLAKQLRRILTRPQSSIATILKEK